MTKQKFKQRVIWILVHFGFYAALYFGIFQNSAGAKNIAIFFVWFVFIIWAISVIASGRKAFEEIPIIGKAFPSWFTVTFDVGATLIMIWAGWVWTPTIYIIGMVFEAAFYKKKEEKKHG